MNKCKIKLCDKCRSLKFNYEIFEILYFKNRDSKVDRREFNFSLTKNEYNSIQFQLTQARKIMKEFDYDTDEIYHLQMILCINAFKNKYGSPAT